MEKQHYGILVNSETPVTGVVHNCTPMWLLEDMYSGINVDFEAHIAECPNEYHDECYYDTGSGTYLVGSWKKDKDGLYEPDKTGEYAGIMGETYTQIVWAKHTRRCSLCSPCYPGQGDLDTPGQFLAYDVPPDLYVK